MTKINGVKYYICSCVCSDAFWFPEGELNGEWLCPYAMHLAHKQRVC